MRTLTSADDGTTVTVEPGETVEIRLPQLGGTGFVWSIGAIADAVVVDDRVELAGDPPPPGDAATRVLRIRPTGSAHAHLRLVRSRPWETAGPSDATFEVTLTTTGS